MAELPTDIEIVGGRATRSRQQHVDDHNELHRLHNILDGSTTPSTGGGGPGAVSATGGGREVVHDVADAGSAATLNLADGNVFDVHNPVAGGTCTLTITGATAGVECGCMIRFHQRSSGDSLLAFAGTVIPMNEGELPGPAQQPNGVSTYALTSPDGGTTWYAYKTGDSESDAGLPGAPTIGVATAGNAEATANWTAPASDGGSVITGYVVKTYRASDDTLLDTDTTGVVLTFVRTGLTNGVDVYFKVAAINANGTGAQSAASNTVTPSASFDFAGLFTKGAFNVDDITGHSDGDAISPWVDGAGFSNFVFDPVYGAGATPIYKTGIVSGKPVLRCVNPSAYFRTLPSPIPQPYTVLWVGRTSAGGILLLNNGAVGVLRLGTGTTNYLRMNAGNQSGGPCADLTTGFHYVLAVFDGASSVLRVDGSVVTFDVGSPGTGSLSTSGLLPGDHSAAGGDPDLRAYGVAPIHPSGPQITAIESFAASLL